MTTGVVDALTRFPVKSMGGERVLEAGVTTRGLEHDRCWAVYTAGGHIASGKTTRRFRRVDGLLQWTAAMNGQVPTVSAPDGRSWHADAPTLVDALREAFGCHLDLRPEGDVPHHDDAAVHVLTTASVRALGERLGDALDPRRFRANVLVDLDHDAGSTTAAWPEDAWIGRTLEVGTVVLRLTAPMTRCVMVTAAQPGLEADPRVLHALADRGVRLGLMAEVVTPGVIREGDRVVVR